MSQGEKEVERPVFSPDSGLLCGDGNTGKWYVAAGPSWAVNRYRVHHESCGLGESSAHLATNLGEPLFALGFAAGNHHAEHPAVEVVDPT